MLRTKILLAATSLLISLSLLAPVVSVQADTVKDQLNSGVGAAGGNTCGGAGQESCQKVLNDRITTVVNILSSLVGVVAVIMIIVGGFRYITSAGDSNRVGSAKNTIIYALIGLVVVALAQIIVQFVLKKAIG